MPGILTMNSQLSFRNSCHAQTEYVIRNGKRIALLQWHGELRIVQFRKGQQLTADEMIECENRIFGKLEQSQ